MMKNSWKWFVWIFFMGCSVQKKSSENIKLKVGFPEKVGFECMTIPVMENDDHARFTVYLQMDDFKYKFDTIHACEPFDKTKFSEYQIPDSALSACGGYYSGDGDYYYCIRQLNDVVVYRGWKGKNPESQSFNYQLVRRFSFTK